MALPLVLALVTALALILVIGPLMRSARRAPERLEFDRAVYRDQLKELERDAARGLIGAEEAAAARTEIERRMLAAARLDEGAARETLPLPRLAGIVAVVIACGAGALYLHFGAPGVPDLPFAERKAPAAAAGGARADIAALQAAVAAKPEDGEAWLTLARAEAERRAWPDAAEAYRRAAALLPGRNDVAAGYGETQVLAADGIVTPAAAETFRTLLTREPKSGIARYYLALADAQAGKTDAAIAAWQALAAETPDGAPLREELKRRIEAAAKSAGTAPPPLAPPAAAAAPAPGPDAAQMAAAAQMSPEARQAMVRGMVERLATRLNAAPDDLDGWLRLARAYATLGERDKSADAFEHAATLDPKNPEIPLGEVDALLGDNALEQPIPGRVVALLHKVEAMAPGQPEALWYLGLVAAQAKQPDEAQRYWQRLLDQLPADAPERQTVSQALASLKAK